MVVALGVKKRNLYYLSCRKAKVKIYVSDTRLNDKSKEFIWHQRFGHLNERSLRTLASMRLVYDLDYNASKQLPFCESCVGGKSHKIPFSRKGRNQAVVPLGLVHSDVCGLMSIESLSGARYFLTFVDDKTHYIWVYVLKSKSEVFSKFLEWKAQVERMSSFHLRILRTDNGGEYTSKEFSNYLKNEGIRHEFTIPKNPEQNGVAERLNRTLVECVRSMLIDAHLPHKFWAEALSTAVFLRNRSETSAVPRMTPFQAWNGKKPSVSNLKVFDVQHSLTFQKTNETNWVPKQEDISFLVMEMLLKGIGSMIQLKLV